MAYIQVEQQEDEAGDRESELEVEGVTNDVSDEREEHAADRPSAHVKRRDDDAPLVRYHLHH